MITRKEEAKQSPWSYDRRFSLTKIADGEGEDTHCVCDNRVDVIFSFEKKKSNFGSFKSFSIALEELTEQEV